MLRLSLLLDLLLWRKNNLWPIALVDCLSPTTQCARNIRLLPRPILLLLLFDLLARALSTLVQFRLMLRRLPVHLGCETLLACMSTTATLANSLRDIPLAGHAHLLALQLAVFRVVLRIRLGDQVLGQRTTSTRPSSARVRGFTVLRGDIVRLAVVDDLVVRAGRVVGS